MTAGAHRVEASDRQPPAERLTGTTVAVMMAVVMMAVVMMAVVMMAVVMMIAVMMAVVMMAVEMMAVEMMAVVMMAIVTTCAATTHVAMHGRAGSWPDTLAYDYAFSFLRCYCLIPNEALLSPPPAPTTACICISSTNAAERQREGEVSAQVCKFTSAQPHLRQETGVDATEYK
jgi:hypothetical protein